MRVIQRQQGSKNSWKTAVGSKKGSVLESEGFEGAKRRAGRGYLGVTFISVDRYKKTSTSNRTAMLPKPQD